METVDVRGLSCPMPVIRTKQAIDKGARELLVGQQVIAGKCQSSGSLPGISNKLKMMIE
jgi:TusA-related sulfurtransferase